MEENKAEDQEANGAPPTENNAIMPTGLKRESVRVKHYDPIPSIEWWDQLLFGENRKAYY
jgi:hypothetical protein